MLIDGNRGGGGLVGRELFAISLFKFVSEFDTMGAPISEDVDDNFGGVGTFSAISFDGRFNDFFASSSSDLSESAYVLRSLFSFSSFRSFGES